MCVAGIISKDNFNNRYKLKDLYVGMHVSWEELVDIHDIEIILSNVSLYRTPDGCVYCEGDITMINGVGFIPENDFTKIYNAVDTDGGVSSAYYSE